MGGRHRGFLDGNRAFDPIASCEGSVKTAQMKDYVAMWTIFRISTPRLPPRAPRGRRSRGVPALLPRAQQCSFRRTQELIELHPWQTTATDPLDPTLPAERRRATSARRSPRRRPRRGDDLLRTVSHEPVGHRLAFGRFTEERQMQTTTSLTAEHDSRIRPRHATAGAAPCRLFDGRSRGVCLGRHAGPGATWAPVPGRTLRPAGCPLSDAVSV